MSSCWNTDRQRAWDEDNRLFAHAAAVRFSRCDDCAWEGEGNGGCAAREAGKDIWIFGGGLLFRSFLEAGLVDTVEVAVIPVLLGGGVPLLPAPAERAKLKLTGHKVYGSGIVLLEYSTEQPQEPSKDHTTEHPKEHSKATRKNRVAREK